MEFQEREVDGIGWIAKKRWTGEEWCALALGIGLILLVIKLALQTN